jgi:hypothetical protein
MICAGQGDSPAEAQAANGTPCAGAIIFAAIALTCPARGQPLPPVTTIQPDTNRYWLAFQWDTVTNATSYSVTVFSNGLVQQIVASTTNFATVSNLPSTLDAFQFKAQAINVAGVSDYSLAAPLHWAALYSSDDLTNWFKAPGVEYDSSTNASRYLRLSNWTYSVELRRQ